MKNNHLIISVFRCFITFQPGSWKLGSGLLLRIVWNISDGRGHPMHVARGESHATFDCQGPMKPWPVWNNFLAEVACSRIHKGFLLNFKHRTCCGDICKEIAGTYLGGTDEGKTCNMSEQLQSLTGRKTSDCFILITIKEQAKKYISVGILAK